MIASVNGCPLATAIMCTSTQCPLMVQYTYKLKPVRAPTNQFWSTEAARERLQLINSTEDKRPLQYHTQLTEESTTNIHSFFLNTESKSEYHISMFQVYKHLGIISQTWTGLQNKTNFISRCGDC